MMVDGWLWGCITIQYLFGMITIHELANPASQDQQHDTGLRPTGEAIGITLLSTKNHVPVSSRISSTFKHVCMCEEQAVMPEKKTQHISGDETCTSIIAPQLIWCHFFQGFPLQNLIESRWVVTILCHSGWMPMAGIQFPYDVYIIIVIVGWLIEII